MAEKKPFDPEKFNTDPAYESERTQFDQMFEGSFARYMEKKKKENPEVVEENIFDLIFGSKKGGAE